MKFSSTLAAAVLVVGVIGFVIGRFTVPDQGAAGAVAAGRGDAVGVAGVAGGSGGAQAAAGERTRAEARRLSAGPVRSGAAALGRMEEIVRGEDALARNAALMEWIDRLAPEEFAAAVAHFRSLGITEERMGEYALLLTAWARVDPVKALEYVRANTNNGFALTTVLGAWAGRDPDAALAWATSHHQGDGPNPFMPGIIRAIAATDLARASSLLTAMPRSRERGDALDGYLAQALRDGPDAARQWAGALQDDSLRNGAISRLAERFAQTDPVGTAKWLAANPGEGAQEAMDTVVGSWAAKDQAAATEFFEKLPAGAIRTSAFRGLVAQAAGDDPAAGAALLDRHPEEATGAINTFVWHSLGDDPALALSYVARIPEDGARNQTYRRALGFWLRRDPAKAGAWIQANAVPQGVLDELRSRGQLQ